MYFPNPKQALFIQHFFKHVSGYLYLFVLLLAELYLRQIHTSSIDRRDIWKYSIGISPGIQFEQLTWRHLFIVACPVTKIQVQEGTGNAAGIAPELARKETVMPPILMKPLYTLSPIQKAICPSLCVSEICLTLLPGDGSPSITCPSLRGFQPDPVATRSLVAALWIIYLLDRQYIEWHTKT